MSVEDFGWKFCSLDDWISTLLGFTLIVKFKLLKRGNTDFRTARILTVEVKSQGLSFTDAIQEKTTVSFPSVRSERDLRLVVSAEGDLYVKLDIESKNLLPREGVDARRSQTGVGQQIGRSLSVCNQNIEKEQAGRTCNRQNG